MSAGSFGYAAPALASGGPHELRLSHPLTAFQSTHPNRALANGTVNVLAIMVQFQADSSSLTIGDGRFVMSPDSGLDAPPHNKNYFENHLLFLKNYFWKVSGGKLNIDYTVLDSVITLPHEMEYYSPPRNDTGNADNLGLLYQDAWHAADSLYPNFDFSQYQCFVIFHAGVGRDLDFTSQFGYDPVPYDLPSIYLSMKSLRSMFGTGYTGEPVANSTFRIPNSIIMPESEHYFIMDTPTDTLIDITLGSNGLLAGNFGSFLGLPDLFDSQTGITGIGRFGLMDGQAMFAYGGLFPPEPSAWEKMYLGWVTPEEVTSPVATQYSLYANETGKYSVLKVPISGSEYFLLENRERDAHHDGEKVTTYYEGGYHTTDIGLAYDTTYFDGLQIYHINGVVTDADEFDWALPEPDYPPDRSTYYGGILIWHIDQSVIDANLASNTINADPSHRGVALMEAHGANEIGRLIQDITGQLYYYDGSAFDFWFKGNPVPSYYNEFTPVSLPSSNSYSGADSHVYVTNFSSADSVMTLDVAVGDSIIAPTAGFPKNIHDATYNSSPVFGHLSTDGKLQVIANNGDSLYAFNMDGTSAGFDSTGFFSKVGGRFQPVVSSENTAGNTVYALDDSVFYGLVDQDNNHDGTADALFSTPLPPPNPRAAGPLLVMGSKVTSFGNVPGTWSVFSTAGNYIASFSAPIAIAVSENSSAFGTAFPSTNPAQFAAADTSVAYINVGGAYGVYRVNMDSVISANVRHPFTAPPPGSNSPYILGMAYGRLSSTGASGVIEVSPQGVYFDTLSSLPSKIFTAFPGDTITSGPVLADLNGDGSRDIIFATQTKVYAITRTGAVLNGFPLSTVGSEVLPGDANTIVGSIAVADLNDDGKPEIIFGTKGGIIYAFTGATAKVFPGFPVSVGRGLAGSPAIAYDSQTGNLYLAAIGLDGYLYSWAFKGSSASQVLWGNLLGGNYHMNSMTQALAAQPVTPTPTLMPADQVYNWPNPVTNGLTKIHFYLRENATVSIGIYSFAGDKVADIQTNGIGGIANEVDWNASGVQSGVYFARVEAVSSKSRDVAIIKIAVVK